MADQSQKAGADSEQYQAGRDIRIGVTAEEVINSTRVRLVTSQAIRAADKLSQEALNGLTALWVIGSLTPTTATVEALLANVQQIAEALLSLGLPSGKGWVSDLDALNLARVAGGFLERRRYNAIVAAWAGDHLVTGIDPSASRQLIESATKAIPELRSKIFPHPLKPWVFEAGREGSKRAIGPTVVRGCLL